MNLMFHNKAKVINYWDLLTGVLLVILTVLPRFESPRFTAICRIVSIWYTDEGGGEGEQVSH